MSFLNKYCEDFKEYDAMERDFIDDGKIWAQLEKWTNPSRDDVRKVLEKAEKKIRLDPEKMAILIQNKDRETINEMYALANRLKREIYGDRIVFFAPLYISNKCANNCKYCGFRRENDKVERRTLTMEEISEEVKIMIGEGQKRTVLVYGESPETNIDFMRESICQVYSTKCGNGEIRRANINCAPLSREELKKLKEVGIGTFQVFQETYHHGTYREMHPEGTIKGHYRWRLYAQDRALDVGLDDVAIGVLFGLYDWRFELMGLLYHTIHLEEKYNGVGPHTISFPRIEPAIGTPYASNPGYSEYAELKHAGADRYLLRIETSNEQLYERLHPGMSYKNRVRCLYDLKELGYETGTDCLIGLPGQTPEMLADDLEFFKELDADMIGMGPFIPCAGTPLEHEDGGDVDTVLKMMALARLLMPDINIPATTALGVKDSDGYKKGLSCGANVIMPNMGRSEYKKLYAIYPGKGVGITNPENQTEAVKATVFQLGRSIGRDYGNRKRVIDNHYQYFL